MTAKRKHLAKAVICFTIIRLCLLFLSCSSSEVILLSDTYWSSAELTRDVMDGVKKRFDEEKLSLKKITVIDPFDLEIVIEKISSLNPRVAILSPLLTQHSVPVAQRFPTTRIIGLATARDSSMDALRNLSMLSSDRRNAYAQAGGFCRRFLEIDDNPRAMVVALFYSGGNVKVSERQAFLDGFGTSTQNERLIVESYPRLDSLRDVNIMLSELSDRDVSIFFISMSALNKEIITTIAAQFTSMVISEKFGGIVSFSDRILATIEEPWAEGVVALAAGTAQTLTPNAVLMPGPALDDPKKDWISAPESR